MKIVAVYWTLKKWFHNHIVMEQAKWVFIKNDKIPFDKIDSIGYPRIKFNKHSNKFINIELYQVQDSGIPYLDSLEWYTPWGQYNLYNRIELTTESGLKVSVYEIVNDIEDYSDEYLDYENTTTNKKYYDWK